MTTLQICSMNCRGLADIKKRKDVFHFFRKSPYDIIMLQDIHCSKERESTFRNSWGSDVFISSGSNNARGVAVIPKRGLSFEIKRKRMTKEIL